MSKHHRRSFWYINSNNLFGWEMMKKLPYKDFKYSATSLDDILNTPDDIDRGFYMVYNVDYNDICKDKTKQLEIMPLKITINDNELDCRQKEKGIARTEKLISDQNNKTEYMVHYRMFKFHVKMGVKETKYIE